MQIKHAILASPACFSFCGAFQPTSLPLPNGTNTDMPHLEFAVRPSPLLSIAHLLSAKNT